MIGETCGNGWGALNPAMAPTAYGKANAQTFVGLTEIVDAADDIHACDNRLGLAGQMAGATGQVRQALAECAIQPFDKGRVDDVAPQALGQQAVNQCPAPLDDTPVNRAVLPLLQLLTV